jgi:hypothetical protein
VGVAIAVAVVGLVVVGHGRGRSASPVRHSARPTVGKQVLFPVLKYPPAAYASDGSVYVVVYSGSGETWVVPKPLPAGHVAVQAPISIGPDNLAGDVDHMLVAAGRLWVTATRGHTTDLLWTDARFGSWSVFSTRLSGPAAPRRDIGPLGANRSVGSMAVAGGWLWVANGTSLDRISLSNPRVTTRIVLGSLLMARGGYVAADPTGRVLLVSEDGYIQRRDPHSGAVIATAGPFDHGAITPQIGGIIDGGAWISDATGVGGRVARLDVNMLKPTPIPAALARASNTIQARVISGILWITHVGDGKRLNYCGDPATGRPRAPLSLPAGARLLTADSGSIYYSRSIHIPDQSAPRFDVVRAPIDPRCQ